MNYAQLDETGTVIGISHISGAVDSANMILLTDDQYAAGLLGWKYENGSFTEPEPQSVPVAPVDPVSELQNTVDIILLKMEGIL